MKKTIKTIFLLITFLIIISVSTNANFNYTQIGENDYNLGTGFFNAQLPSTALSSRNINNPTLTPMIADLDNDGTNEIVIYDGTTVRLYQSKTLTIIDSFTAGTTITGAILYDIDDDNFTEIIITGTNDLEIIEYNGTHIFNQTSFINGLSGYETGQQPSAIQCQQTERCITIYNERLSGTGGNSGAIEYATFNSTNIVAQGEIFSSSNNLEACLPLIPTITVANYDSHVDADDEIIFSYLDTDASSGTLRITYAHINSTLNISIEQTITETDIVNMVEFDCDNVLDLFTSPLVFNIDGAISNGLETVIGFMISSDDFKMYSFSSNGNFLDDYPEITNGEGILISNVLLTNVFTDTGLVDFCVMGYENEADLLNLVCASEETGDIPETVEFDWDKTGIYNVTEGYNLITHSVQHSTITTDGTDLTEIINSYGVFRVNFTGINELDLIFENPKANAVLLSVDVEKTGREDLLALTSTNIWYIDDRFSTSGANIDEYTVNPCIDSTWEQNTTVGVTITPTDEDGDDVNARAILYDGETFNQTSAWSINVSTGTTIPFTFTANETISAGTLTLQARDTSDPLEIDEIELTISVGSQGVEFGDCITTETDITEAEAEAEETIVVGNDTISESIDQINSVTGMNLSRPSWWLLIMIFVAVLVWRGGSQDDPQTTFGAICIAEILMLLLGLRLGYIGFGTIFILVIIAVAIIVAKVRKTFTGG